jgi:hypothetical protein
MKTQKMKSILLAMLAMLAAINFTLAQEVSKTINKDFLVNRDANLIVDNRFGKIHCNVWDQNQITIEVVITATARNQREAERLIESVDVNISGNNAKVKAVTNISGRVGGDKSSLSVDYTINMPRTLKLELINRFGDIYLDENSGSSEITLEYGNLQINRLSGNDHRLNMSFGKGMLGKADKLELDLSYSELTSNEIQNLVINSRFSTFEVETAGSISQDSQYDTNRLGDLSSVKTVARFSNISIGSISDRLELDLQYGGCTVKEIGLEFKDINIQNSFGNVELRFSPGASFRLDAESSFGNISFPKKSNVVVEETSFTGKKFEGTVGDDSQPSGVVNISTKNGDVSLKMN